MMKKVTTIFLTAGLLLSTSQISAADLVASSPQPSVWFTDTNTNTILGAWQMDDTTVDYDFLGFWANQYQKWMIQMQISSKTENSIYVASNGNMALGNTIVIDRIYGRVGIGKFPALGDLDIYGSISAGGDFTNNVGDGLTNLLTLHVKNNQTGKTSDAGFALLNERTSKQWNFRTASDGAAFAATMQGTGGAEFQITNNTGSYKGAQLYLGNGAKNVGGIWYNASSRALKENIKPLSTKDALTAFSKLQPVTYNYKTDKSEKVVGFIAEDVPDLVAINSRDALSSMDMVAVLTKVVQEQDKTLAETRTELKIAQEKITKLEAMQKRLAKMESLLTNMALNTAGIDKKKVSLNLK